MIRENDKNGRVFDVSVELKDNAMLKKRPDLFDEWDFIQNDLNGLDIYKMTKGMNRKVWWICPKCDSDYDAAIVERILRNASCSYCKGKRVNHTNSLASMNPYLSTQWHPIKNGNTNPNSVTYKNGIKVWWLGDCKHEWEARISDRARGNDCPYCNKSNPKTLKGFNDMWTTNPELSSLLADYEDGYKYSEGSNTKVNWKCPTCGEIIKNKTISRIKSKGLSCGNCMDSISLPEKIMYHTLKSFGVDFEFDISQSWSNNKRYDFYLPDYNMIIETHGIQHYKNTGRGRSIEEERENDRSKKEVATQNSIKYYIEIDCSNTEFEQIKNNIIDSELNSVFDLNTIDWAEINLSSQKSINGEILRLWNEENLCGADIAKVVKLHSSTVLKVLKNYDTLGKCVFDPYRRRTEANHTTKKIYQFSDDFNLVKIWIGGAYSIQKETGILTTSIYTCCKGKRKTAGGFIWKYEQDLIGLSMPLSK